MLNKNRARYKHGFTDKIKKEIKNRDENRCQICRSTIKLEVHHIDGNLFLIILKKRCQKYEKSHAATKSLPLELFEIFSVFLSILEWFFSTE